MFFVGPLGLVALSTVNPTRGGRPVSGQGRQPAHLYAHEDLSAWNRLQECSRNFLGRVPGLTSHLSARAQVGDLDDLTAVCPLGLDVCPSPPQSSEWDLRGGQLPFSKPQPSPRKDRQG